MEPAVDTFLEFEFFHARSGLGQKELTKDDYAALRERLLPYRRFVQCAREDATGKRGIVFAWEVRNSHGAREREEGGGAQAWGAVASG